MSNAEDLNSSAAPLIEHLKELRNRILYALGAFLVFFCLGYYLWDLFLCVPVAPDVRGDARAGQKCKLVLIKVQEGFFVA